MYVLLLILIIELCWRPRLDITSEKELLIWYGRKDKRNYWKI